MNSFQSVVVALVGASASGKSTLARRAARELPSVEVVKLDDFYKDANEFPMVRSFRNWEVPENVKFDDLYHCLRDLKSGRSVCVPNYSKLAGCEVSRRIAWPARLVLVEGFLLLHDSRIRDLVDHIVLLKVDYKILRERRFKRESGLDAKYYDQVVLPAFEEHESEIEKLADVIIESNESAEAVWRTFKALATAFC